MYRCLVPVCLLITYAVAGYLFVPSLQLPVHFMAWKLNLYCFIWKRGGGISSLCYFCLCSVWKTIHFPYFSILERMGFCLACEKLRFLSINLRQMPFSESLEWNLNSIEYFSQRWILCIHQSESSHYVDFLISLQFSLSTSSQAIGSIRIRITVIRTTARIKRVAKVRKLTNSEFQPSIGKAWPQQQHFNFFSLHIFVPQDRSLNRNYHLGHRRN